MNIVYSYDEDGKIHAIHLYRPEDSARPRATLCGATVATVCRSLGFMTNSAEEAKLDGRYLSNVCADCVAADEILSDPETMKLLDEAEADIKAGRMIPGDEVRREGRTP